MTKKIKKCKKCKSAMEYVGISTNDSKTMTDEFYQCVKCGYEQPLRKSKYHKKVMKKQKTAVTNIDKTEPIRKLVMPKLQDEFYLIGNEQKQKRYYNPITNTLRIENKVMGFRERNDFIHLILTGIVA